MRNPTVFKSSKLALAVSLTAALAASPAVLADDATTTNVMAPLEVSDWNSFSQQLATAKSMGVDAVSVDVWWGKVEGAGDQIFDWSYYDTMVQHLENAGLDWVPIMSFHQCGGNVGDDCNIPIPGWIWNHFSGTSANDLKYRSEQNNFSNETVSLWADNLVINEYIEFMNEFESHFGAKAAMIDEINVSMGPAGELRYPSYNSHDSGTGYPTRGAFQAYSEPAKADFRNWTIAKYGSLSGVNSAWGFGLGSVNDINPPSNAESFVSNGEHFNTQYGKDFVRWYHDSLTDHGNRMMDAAIVAFNGFFSNIELGFKIPGIHWQIGNPSNYSRSAEIAAGLIPTDVNLWSDATAHGYSSIISVAADYASSGRDVVLHFTALEMDNQNWAPQYSRAKDLVFWVAGGAADQNVVIKGENALAGGVGTNTGWNNIENAFTFASYSGMTVLRINNVTTGGTGQSRYSSFIQNFHAGTPGGDANVTFTCNNGNTYWGQSVYVVGNIAQLGGWNPANGVQMDAPSYPTWTKTVAVPANTAIHWKCVKREESDPTAGVEWQPGTQNNQVTSGNAGTTVTSSGSF